MVKNNELEWTGERFLPRLSGDIALEHYHRYAFACSLAQRKRVLDIACGEGYGANMLADTAAHVLGIDIDPVTVAHASTVYRRPNLDFRQGFCTKTDLSDASIDLVVSFETLEHHADHDAMLSELRRILTPEGMLVISTPDKRNYSDVSNYHNAFHVRELYADEFIALIQRYFPYAVFLGQKVVYGSILTPTGSSNFLSFTMEHGAIQKHTMLETPPYLLAVASARPTPDMPTSLLDETAPHLLEMNRLRQERQVALDLLASIHASAYWRLAAPIRWMRKGLKRFRGK